MIRKSSIFISFIAQLFACVSFAQQVTITGSVDTAYLSHTTTIYAYTYADQISYSEKELASSQLDEKGNFNLNFPLVATSNVFLMADNGKAEMICEPGKTYDILVLPKDSNAANTLSLAVSVGLEFRNSNETELNYLLADFTSRFEAFLEDHRGMITKKEASMFGKIDTIKTLFKKKYYMYNNAYLNNYVEYTFASLEESISFKEKENIFEKYIHGKKIQATNYDYMLFLHQFYAPLTDQFMKSGKTQLEINGKQNLPSLLTLFKQHKFLLNDTICEMVVLKSLSEYYRYPDAYKTNAILTILDQAAVQFKLEANRKSAENIRKKLSVMAIGKPAPSMSFQNPDGKAVILADFKGKYVYLTFWTSWSTNSTQELALITEHKKLYGNKIAFVSICLDKNIETMKNYIRKNPKLDWTFLYCDNYKKAKEEFNVLTVPTYYMLDPKGNVYRSPASNPIEIEPLFVKIKKKQQ